MVFHTRSLTVARPVSRLGTLRHIRSHKVAIDPETFQEFIAQLSESYTAERYHLITHNCNHFTQEVVEFLTGGSIPAWISGWSHLEEDQAC